METSSLQQELCPLCRCVLCAGMYECTGTYGDSVYCLFLYAAVFLSASFCAELAVESKRKVSDSATSVSAPVARIKFHVLISGFLSLQITATAQVGVELQGRNKPFSFYYFDTAQ